MVWQNRFGGAKKVGPKKVGGGFATNGVGNWFQSSRTIIPYSLVERQTETCQQIANIGGCQPLLVLLIVRTVAELRFLAHRKNLPIA